MAKRELIAATPEEREAYSNERKAFRERWSDASKLASAIRYRRANIFAGADDPLGALRELAWPTQWGRGEEIIQACYDNGEHCEKALTAVRSAYGVLGVVQNEPVVDDRVGDRHNSHVVIDLVATAAEARGSGWVVKGRAFEPGKVRNCLGGFKTQEIVAVRPKSVTVRETQWCQKVTYSLSKGLQVTYEIDDLPFALTEGSQLRVLVDRTQVACRDGMVRQCTAKNAAVIAANTNEQAWRAGGVMPFGAAGPY